MGRQMVTICPDGASRLGNKALCGNLFQVDYLCMQILNRTKLRSRWTRHAQDRAMSPNQSRAG